MDFPFLDWEAFLTELLTHAPEIVKERLRDKSLQFSITNRRGLKRLDVLRLGRFTARQLANYINVRLLDDHYPMCAIGQSSQFYHISTFEHFQPTFTAIKSLGPILLTHISKHVHFIC
jgi:hypothetical protein